MFGKVLGSLSMKLFIFSFCAVSCLVLLLGIVSRSYISEQFNSQQSSYVAHTLNRTDYYLNQFMKGLQKDLLFMTRDGRLLSSTPEELAELLEHYKLQWNQDIKNLYIMKDQGSVLGTSRLLWELAPADEVSRLYESLTSSDASFIWTEPYFSPVSDYTVTLAVRLNDGNAGDAGILAADLDLDSILAVYEDHDYSSRESLLIMSRTDKPISVRSPFVTYDVFAKAYGIRGFPAGSLQHNQSSWQTFDDDGRRLRFTRANSNQWGWQVMLIMDESLLDRASAFLKTLSLGIGIAGLILSFLVSYTLAQYITRPLHQLIRQMMKVSEGQFQTQVHMRRKDELGIVGAAFNRMVAKVKLLMDEVVQIEIKKKHYELKVLQTQIQPHFLYNTLNAISYLAKHGKAAEVDEMITHLSSLLHFHLDKVEELVTFAEELDGVKRYAALMDMRYPGQFILDLDVSEETLTTPIPKFTLQPLVENAIFHGLLPKGELGSIVVSGEREASTVLIRVEDDGIGIPEERRHALLTEKPTSPAAGYYHLGLSSIHERLRLYYGESCGLNIISPDQGGTRIEIRIPAQGSGGVSA